MVCVCAARRVIACACVCELPAGRGDRGGGVIIALWMVWNKVSLLSAWSQTEMLMQMVFTPHPSVWYNDSPTNSMYEETERRRCINKNSAHLCENDFSLPSGNLRHTFTLSLRASSISHFSWYFFFYFLSFDNRQSRDFCEEKYSCEKKEWRWVLEKTWPSTGNVNLISNSLTKSRCFQHTKWDVCVLVIGCRSPRLHLEKIRIFSSILLNHEQPTGWHWCAFQTLGE